MRSRPREPVACLVERLDHPRRPPGARRPRHLSTGSAPQVDRWHLAAPDASHPDLSALRNGRRRADVGVRADGVQGDLPLRVVSRAVRAREGDLMVSTRVPERITRGAFHTLTVADIERLCDDAVAVTFDVPDELRDEYAFEAGQSLTLRRVINGEDHRRDYSICARVGERPRVGVRLIPGVALLGVAGQRGPAGGRGRGADPARQLPGSPDGGRAPVHRCRVRDHADALDRLDRADPSEVATDACSTATAPPGR